MAIAGSKWRRTELTYRISQYPSKRNLKPSDVDREIARAFQVWSDVTPLNFIVKKDGRVHIDIRFVTGEHGDGDPFDGPGSTLAHAYFPQYGGDAHFDNEEQWTVSSYAGKKGNSSSLFCMPTYTDLAQAPIFSKSPPTNLVIHWGWATAVCAIR